jgi:hypothetical protein
MLLPANTTMRSLSFARAPSDTISELRRHFSEAETVKLSLFIVAINGWNRRVIGARVQHPVAETALEGIAPRRCGRGEPRI